MNFDQQHAKRLLRHKYRALRRSLGAQEQIAAAYNLRRQARKYVPLLRAERCATYNPCAGEIDTRPLEQDLSAQLFLPKITHLRHGRMKFFPHTVTGHTANSMGIIEPLASGQAVDPRHLDAVLMPLVAFQRNGIRLGQGGGFYDRAFSFRQQKCSLKRPLLIGVGHHFQETTNLPTQPWDVPLDAIITDLELIVL